MAVTTLTILRIPKVYPFLYTILSLQIAQFGTEFTDEDLPVPKEVLLATVDIVDMSSVIYSGGRKSKNIRRENLVPCPTHAVKGESVALLLSQIKDEIGTEGSDPTIQGGLSVRHFWAQTNRTNYRNATCCPTLIFAPAGPWMAVFGEVFTDKLIIEPLTDLIRVVNLRLNSPHYRRISRLFHVFGNCLTSLAKY
ncbi:hypothetical protein ARMSODRAFT_90940 [Armillaria solidipes]|uniref:Uncharacterized protein n=1 Tax=Armillaria solidipes TaxID=1076256 RepID=A0A2H3BXG4_9AGAR|nr:hypothetical protein ARMSODRAFT_90940 [Armillaria solidipes]